MSVDPEVVSALQARVDALTATADEARRERAATDAARLELAKERAELAALRREHDKDLAADRAAWEAEKVAYRARVKEFVARLSSAASGEVAA